MTLPQALALAQRVEEHACVRADELVVGGADFAGFRRDVAPQELGQQADLAAQRQVVFRSGARPLPAGAILTVAGTVSPSGTIEVLPILDAAGAGATPRGGIATGAGGTAPADGAGLALLLTAAGLALMVGGAIAVGRRRRGSAR